MPPGPAQPPPLIDRETWKKQTRSKANSDLLGLGFAWIASLAIIAGLGVTFYYCEGKQTGTLPGGANLAAIVIPLGSLFGKLVGTWQNEAVGRGIWRKIANKGVHLETLTNASAIYGGMGWSGLQASWRESKFLAFCFVGAQVGMAAAWATVLGSGIQTTVAPASMPITVSQQVCDNAEAAGLIHRGNDLWQEQLLSNTIKHAVQNQTVASFVMNAIPANATWEQEWHTWVANCSIVDPVYQQSVIYWNVDAQTDGLKYYVGVDAVLGVAAISTFARAGINGTEYPTHSLAVVLNTTYYGGNNGVVGAYCAASRQQASISIKPSANSVGSLSSTPAIGSYDQLGRAVVQTSMIRNVDVRKNAVYGPPDADWFGTAQSAEELLGMMEQFISLYPLTSLDLASSTAFCDGSHVYSSGQLLVIYRYNWQRLWIALGLAVAPLLLCFFSPHACVEDVRNGYGSLLRLLYSTWPENQEHGVGGWTEVPDESAERIVKLGWYTDQYGLASSYAVVYNDDEQNDLLRLVKRRPAEGANLV